MTKTMDDWWNDWRQMICQCEPCQTSYEVAFYAGAFAFMLNLQAYAQRETPAESVDIGVFMDANRAAFERHQATCSRRHHVVRSYDRSDGGGHIH